MLPFGTIRHIDFSIADLESLPVPGRTLAGWLVAPNRLIFLRDQADCVDALTLHDYGDGRYTVSYLPSAMGHDYLQIYDEPTGLKVEDVEDIVALGGSASVPVTVDHNYGGTDLLRLTGVTNPEQYTVQVFFATDWEQNRRDDTSAAGISDLDAAGRWRKQLPLIPGVYHVVARCFREVRMLKLNLAVT